LSVALIIFVVTIVVSLLALFAAPKLAERSLFRPYWFLRRHQYATVLTSGLVHGDLPHLIFNMMTYWFFAFQLERRIGSVAFAGLYLAGQLFSDVGTYFKHRDDPQYASLGASGAILAVLFASILYYPGNSLFIFPIPLPIPAPIFAVGYVAFSWYMSRQNKGRINHDAHLGGALTGVAFVLLTDPAVVANFVRTVL
jgi:membrane associated rhomboid family serine protease